MTHYPVLTISTTAAASPRQPRPYSSSSAPPSVRAKQSTKRYPSAVLSWADRPAQTLAGHPTCWAFSCERRWHVLCLDNCGSEAESSPEAAGPLQDGARRPGKRRAFLALLTQPPKSRVARMPIGLPLETAWRGSASSRLPVAFLSWQPEAGGGGKLVRIEKGPQHVAGSKPSTMTMDAPEVVSRAILPRR